MVPLGAGVEISRRACGLCCCGIGGGKSGEGSATWSPPSAWYPEMFCANQVLFLPRHILQICSQRTEDLAAVPPTALGMVTVNKI